MKTQYLSRWRYLYLTPFETHTEAGRSRERYRLALWTLFASGLSRGAALFVMVLSVSWTLPYLGVDRFGIWMTLASLIGILLFLDLGIGNALTNQVAHTAAKGCASDLSRVVSGGLGLLFFVSAVVAVVLSASVMWLPWQLVLPGLNPKNYEEVRSSLLLLAVLFSTNLVTQGVHRVFAGLQRSFEGHLVAACASTLSLWMLWLAANRQAGIPLLLLATLGCQSLAGLILWTLLIKRNLFRFPGIWKAISKEKKSLGQAGGLFFVLQLSAIVGLGVDSLVIALTLGTSQVAVYSLAQRLFQMIGQPLAMLNAPLWSAYADANAMNDGAFIRSTLKKSLAITAVLGATGGGVLLIFHQEIISWWTKDLLHIPVAVIVVFFFWTLCDALGSCFAMMLNGCGVIRAQVIAATTLLVVTIPVKLVAVRMGGVEGMVGSYIAIYCSVLIGVYGFLYRKAWVEKLGDR